MKKLFNLLFILLAVFFINSCGELDEDLQGDFTEAPEDDGGGGGGGETSATAAGAFSKLFGSGIGGNGNYFEINEVSTDEMCVPAKGGDWYDGGILVDLHQHNWQTTLASINNTWNTQYDAIGECNRVLANSSTSAADAAQVRVLRAYFYYRLLDDFGNVKIVTTPGEDVPQSNRQQVFDFVESELLDAINSGDLGTTRGDVARVNEFAARGLLARVYLNAEVYTGTAMWQEAADQAEAVINSGLYELSPNYSDVFSPTNTDNIEHIWVIPFDETDGQGMNYAQMTLHYGSQETFNLQEQPWNGFTSIEDFYNSYEDGDERKENNFLVGPQFSNPDGTGDPIIDLATEGSLDPDGFQLTYTPEINELFPNAIRQGGARLFKYNFKQGQRANMDNDLPIVRYGDVLLIKAEAEARLAGNWSAPETLALVNQLRTRADVGTYTSLTEQEFFDERGREMFMEVSRRQDLIRFGKWADEWWEKPSYSDPGGDRELFPIPFAQIQSSQATSNPLTQNPGY